MTGGADTGRRGPFSWARLAAEESGAVLIEFAVVVSLFFFLFYTLLDFGRLSYSQVLAEKAAQVAARIAIVRPPACGGVPETHARGTVDSGTTPPRYGTACSAGTGVCADVEPTSCQGVASNATASEIWARIAPFVPPDAEIGALQFTYTYDQSMGFLGGPYTPIVTVDLNLPDFQFISPLGAIATAAGATNTGTLGSDIAYTTFSVSLPAEDLAAGESG